MKITIPVFYKNTMNSKETGVWGEEIIANACVKMLNKHGIEAEVYGLHEPRPEADMTLFMAFNMVFPKLLSGIPGKKILWIEGFSYGDNGKVIPLDQIYDSMAPHYDLIITSSRKLAKDKGIPFLVPPVDFEIYKPMETTPSPCLSAASPEMGRGKSVAPKDITFIGNVIKPFETNKKYLEPMKDFNYEIYGGDFGKVSHEEWMRIVAGSKINLHYGFEEGIGWDMVTGSTLFIAAAGGFCLSDEVPFLKEKFDGCFGFTMGGDEEREKIKYYLENEELRGVMSARALESVRSMDFDALADIIKNV